MRRAKMAEKPEVALRNAEIPFIGIPVGRFRTAREINEWHREFYSEQSKLMEERMADEDVLDVAIKDLQSEALRQVPVYFQKSFEGALESAAVSKVRFQKSGAKNFQSDFSRKGGTASKTDALQKLILEKVRVNPEITERQLLDHLREKCVGIVVTDIDDTLGEIDFDNDGRQKTARITGLKDRLSRAKKTIAAEKQITSR
jgi:hypothetical protein